MSQDVRFIHGIKLMTLIKTQKFQTELIEAFEVEDHALALIH